MTRSQVEHDRAVAEKAIRHVAMNPDGWYEETIQRYLDREYPLPCKECGGRVAVPEDVKQAARGIVASNLPTYTNTSIVARWILSLAEGAK